MREPTLHGGAQRGAGRATRRPLVLASLMLAMFTSAIEGTIVATAMPDIVASLGGFSLYSWVFSSFLLMQAVSIPIFGKLADLFGRKPVLIAGIGIFLLGSVLCGVAPTMGLLVAFRFLQGLGAGAIQPISTTLVGDLYPLEERARIQGWLASVWGVSAVVGPLVGGLIVQYWHWSWIFLLNVPFGLLAALGVLLFLRESPQRSARSVDYPGAGLFLVGVAALMVVLVQGGTAWAWSSGPVLALSALAAVASALFLWRQSRAREPLMPLSIWRVPLIALANAATFAAGVMLIGLTAFLPTYVQGVMGRSAVVAGFALTAMSVGWPLASTAAGHLVVRLGSRMTARLGGTALLLGGAGLLLLTPERGPWWAGASSFVTGVGMGLANTTYIVSVQSSVEWARRGVATASNMFMRILGNAVGAALLGGVLNGALLGALRRAGSSATPDDLQALLEAGAAPGLVGAEHALLQAALERGLHAVYLVVAGFAAVSWLLSLAVPDMTERRGAA